VLELTQGFEVLAVADPVNEEVLPTQALNVPVIVGSALTVTVTCFVQPVLLVKVIRDVPADMALIRPELFTVATAVLELIQGIVVEGVPVPVSWVVEPAQVISTPEIFGFELTVTNTASLQPSLVVYVTVADPTFTAVTTPVVEIVNIVGSLETQGLVVAAVPEPVRLDVDSIQTLVLPDIVGATVAVIVLLQPKELMYVIFVLPVAATAVTRPAELIVATPGLELVHGLSVAGVPFPNKLRLPPKQIVVPPVIIGLGVIAIDLLTLHP
jgi:hypothetical protein